MKQILLRATFLASILLIAASCNDDDDDGNSTPTPLPYTFTATENDPINNTNSDWVATSASAQLNLDGTFEVTATNGSDEVFFKISGNQVGAFVVDTLSVLRDDNYYVASNSDEFGITDSTGTLSFVITANDVDNQMISGSFNAVFYNLDGSLDLVVLQDGVVIDLPYTIETPDLGGAGSISFTADGTNVVLDQIFSSNNSGMVQLTASSLSSPTTSLTMSFPEDIAPGDYDLSSIFSDVSVTYSSGSQVFFSDSGTMTVSSNDTDADQLEGTFNLTGSELLGSGTVTITNGVFDIEY
ncbi:DUF6252 family protein [Cryomorphaceae bacterium 1068]|nr:DUF6252 family protein [Cryomorphaceae bacterium 1068]